MMYAVAYETETAWGVDEEVVFTGTYEECETYVEADDGDEELYIVEA